MNIGIVTTWFERGAAYVSRQYREVLEPEDPVGRKHGYADAGDPGIAAAKRGALEHVPRVAGAARDANRSLQATKQHA